MLSYGCKGVHACSCLCVVAPSSRGAKVCRARPPLLPPAAATPSSTCRVPSEAPAPQQPSRHHGMAGQLGGPGHTSVEGAAAGEGGGVLGALRGLVASSHRHPGTEAFGHTPSTAEAVANALVGRGGVERSGQGSGEAAGACRQVGSLPCAKQQRRHPSVLSCRAPMGPCSRCCVAALCALPPQLSGVEHVAEEAEAVGAALGLGGGGEGHGQGKAPGASVCAVGGEGGGGLRAGSWRVAAAMGSVVVLGAQAMLLLERRAGAPIPLTLRAGCRRPFARPKPRQGPAAIVQ